MVVVLAACSQGDVKTGCFGVKPFGSNNPPVFSNQKEFCFKVDVQINKIPTDRFWKFYFIIYQDISDLIFVHSLDALKNGGRSYDLEIKHIGRLRGKYGFGLDSKNSWNLPHRSFYEPLEKSTLPCSSKKGKYSGLVKEISFPVFPDVMPDGQKVIVDYKLKYYDTSIRKYCTKKIKIILMINFKGSKKSSDKIEKT